MSVELSHNEPEITHGQLFRLVGSLLLRQVRHAILGEPLPPALFIWGHVGIGKSTVVRRVYNYLLLNKEDPIAARYLGDIKRELDKLLEGREFSPVFVDLRASQLTPQAIFGTPVPTEGDINVLMARKVSPNMQTIFAVPQYFPVDPKKIGILFLDELNTAEPEILHALRKVLLQHEVATSKLSPGVLVLAAGNFTSEIASIEHTMDIAVRSRMVHVILRVPTVDEWIEEYAVVAKVPEIIVMFLKMHPDQFSVFKPGSETIPETVVFPTPRTWAFAGELMKITAKDALEFLKSPSENEALKNEALSKLCLCVKMACGHDAASAFGMFLETWLNSPIIRGLLEVVSMLRQADLLIKEYFEVMQKYRKGEIRRKQKGYIEPTVSARVKRIIDRLARLRKQFVPYMEKMVASLTGREGIKNAVEAVQLIVRIYGKIYRRAYALLTTEPGGTVPAEISNLFERVCEREQSLGGEER